MILLLWACGISSQIREGKTALEAGDLVRSEAAWRAVLEADPDNAEGLFGLGWTYHLAGQEDPARVSFQTCINAHPEAAPCYRGLGSLAMAEGNTTLARKRFGEALERAPGDVATRHSLGLLELATRNADKALLIFQELLAKEPDKSEYLQAASECMLSLGRTQEAVDLATKSLENAKDPRRKVLALMSRSRALVNLSGNRVDSANCAATAPPVLDLLEEANRNLDLAQSFGVEVPELFEVRRQVQRRKGAVEDQCPGARGTGG